MNCPTCDIELKIADRHGVEIDYCPKCRGVWLDRGELDKILDRATEMMRPIHQEPAPQPVQPVQPATPGAPPIPSHPQQGYPQQGYPQGPVVIYKDDDDDDDYYKRHGYKKKRKNWLGDIFDFD